MIKIPILTRKRKLYLHIKALASFVDNLEYPNWELILRYPSLSYEAIRGALVVLKPDSLTMSA